MPTPAVRAISSIEASAPSAAKSARAASTNRARFRSASARGLRALPCAAGSTSTVSGATCRPFHLAADASREIACNRREPPLSIRRRRPYQAAYPDRTPPRSRNPGATMSIETSAASRAVPGTRTEYANRGWILAVMCLALVMVVAGVSMLDNALPSIAADLDASQSSQQWIVDAYALTLAALLLPAGALGDRFGRRGALIAGTAIFGIAAGLSALAGSADELIALRALMGIGAALLMPGTLSTITSVFPPEERAKAVGIWAGFAGAGGTLGILASGALLEQFAWGSVFVLTGALAALACVGVVLFVPSTRAEERVAFDIRGSLVSAV